MKRYFIRIKVCMGGLLLLLCLFVVPVAALANADVSSTHLSSLEQIEPLINDSPEVLAALSANARDEALETLKRQGTGAKYFGGITYGYSNEPTFDTSEDRTTYNKLNVTGGLTFPLLGTLQKEKIGVFETETATMESKYRSNMLLLNNLVALRKAYATLWIEQQKEQIAKRFLNMEAETGRILQERQARGLLLPTDRLELLSVFQDVKRDIAASKMRQIQALKIINLATGHKWGMTEELKAPSLPSIEGKRVDLDNYPEVVFQNNLVSQYEKILAEKERIDREANISIGLTASRDFPGATGNGAYIAFSMTEPVREVGAKEPAKLAAAADLSRLKEEKRFVRLKLEGQVEETLARVAYAAADVDARASHLTVMAESIREKMLRRVVLPGDTFEQLQHSKSQYYKAALDMLDHEELFLQSEIDIISYIYPKGLGSELTERVFPINDHDAIRNKLLASNWLESNNVQDDMNSPLDFSSIHGSEIPVIAFESMEKAPANPVEKGPAIPVEKMQTAVYVWNAQPFLQSDTRTAALHEIVDAGFSRMLVSFTPTQVSDLLSPTGREELEALICEAKSKKVRIDLLLGDSTWLETDHRTELLSLIKQLRKFDFDGIHLDIEPDLLPDAQSRRAELLEDLADTIKAVKETTILPVSISLHPRYLEGDLGVLARQKLFPIGLEEVVVMIYSDKPQLTAQRMVAIIVSNPNMAFSLAQSVEKNVPSGESYANFTQQEFKDVLHIFEDNLAGYGLKGIYIQAWEDYKKGETQ